MEAGAELGTAQQSGRVRLNGGVVKHDSGGVEGGAKLVGSRLCTEGTT